MLPSEHYRAERQRVTEIVRGLTAGQLGTTVPACPAWTVRDLVAHLAGVTVDLGAGRFEGAGSDPWTAAQVAARKGRDVEELLAEWAEHAPPLEAGMDAFGVAAHRLVYDLTMHEDDLREAVGLPFGAGPAQRTVLDGLAGLAGKRLSKAGVPALRLRAGAREWVAGEGEPAATVTAPDEGELARVLGGRRSPDEMRALDWDGGPEPYLPHLPMLVRA